MRELKFRAWDGDRYWYNIVPSPIRSMTIDICKEVTSHEPEYWNMVDVIEGVESVEQYTGLKDKNGKEIYEGDIIDVSSVFVNPKKMIVEFSEMACGFEPFVNGCSDCYFPAGKDVEVIGNIHENPELLGGEE